MKRRQTFWLAPAAGIALSCLVSGCDENQTVQTRPQIALEATPAAQAEPVDPRVVTRDLDDGDREITTYYDAEHRRPKCHYRERHGRKHGELMEWDEQGQVTRRVNYEDGRIVW